MSNYLSLENRIKNINSDFVGVMSAFLCIIHCAVVPILMAVHSFYYAGNFTVATHNHIEHEGHLHENTSFIDIIQGSHWHALDYFFIIITLVAVYFATRKNVVSWIKIGLWSAASIFVVSILLAETITGIHYFAYLASALLIVFHFLNQRLSKRVKSTIIVTKPNAVNQNELNFDKVSFESMILEKELEVKKQNRVSCAC